MKIVTGLSNKLGTVLNGFNVLELHQLLVMK